MVYEDAEKLYAEVKKDGERMIKDAFKILFHGMLAPANAGGSLVAYNTTFFPRREVAPIALDGSADLVRQVAQVSADGKTGYALLDAPEGNGIARPIGMFADARPVSGGLLVDSKRSSRS
jgi:alpha-mannosidase